MPIISALSDATSRSPRTLPPSAPCPCRAMNHPRERPTAAGRHRHLHVWAHESDACIRHAVITTLENPSLQSPLEHLDPPRQGQRCKEARCKEASCEALGGRAWLRDRQGAARAAPHIIIGRLAGAAFSSMEARPREAAEVTKGGRGRDGRDAQERTSSEALEHRSRNDARQPDCLSERRRRRWR
jgi:hypothetical protein